MPGLKTAVKLLAVARVSFYITAKSAHAEMSQKDDDDDDDFVAFVNV